GLYNGYYYVSNLHPGTHSYSNNQAALTGVKPPLEHVADFTANITTVLTGSCVCFTDLSEHTPNSWSWTFSGGNPSSSDVQNPENIYYNTPGTYAVSLSVTNWNGSNTITKTDYITVTDDAMPVADFDVDETNACVGTTFLFTDLSLNTPNQWQWSFIPNTVTFVNSTNANSQNPEVQFNEAKIYSVTLTVTNSNGSNSITKSNLINSGGLALPFVETFEVATFKDYWTIENPDGNITWDGYYKLSGNLPSRKSAWMNFYEYTSTGQRDRLITPLLNFTGHTSVNFQFTHAYAIYNSSRKDSVIIYISTDCGISWERIFEAGEDFATHAPTTSDFVPSSAGDWCGVGYGDDCHNLDLSPWAGNANVKIMFESYNGHGNMMYIDDIVIYDNDVLADFTADVTIISPGESVNFTDLSTGTVNSWEWIFNGGTPLTSNAINPSNIIYEIPGIYDVTLTVSNDSCSDTKIKENYITVNSNGPYVVQQNYEINDNSGNGNGLMDYGESILLSLGMKNVGSQQANNVTVELNTNDSFITITDNIEYYGTIPANEIITITDGFAFNVSELIPDGHSVLFDVTAYDGNNTWTSNFTIEAHAPYIEFGELDVLDPTGNNNGRLDPGETADIIITTTNIGSSDAINSIGNLSTTNGDITINNATYNFGTLSSGQTDYAVFNVTVNPSAQNGTTVDFNYVFSSGLFYAQYDYYITIGLIVEDWETGDFSQFNWTFSGDSPWIITSSNPYEGAYCAKSGSIGDSQSSQLILVYELMSNDSISFYKKVSSEEAYDYLIFFIDNIIQDKWSGNEAWSKVVYPVSAGEHTFKWVYLKDTYVSSGSDCCWIDYIVLPPASILTVNAGVDATICAGNTFTCSGNATNYNSLLWTTTGTGTFNDNTILNPIYTPSTDDINSGSVILTLTAYDGQGDDISDDMTLTIAPVPVVDLGNDTTICCYESIILDAENPGASYIWSTGDTTQTIIIDSTGVGIGSQIYYVIVTNEYNCQGTDSITITFDTCTNITEIINNHSITLSPNPSNGIFNILIERLNEHFDLYVINIQGQVIYNESFNCNSDKYIKKLNFSEFKKGIYYLKLINNDIVHIERFIIQ
ncbi:MAG: PKD domain-containing protein, partial [Bacteroidales bacterium]|nr:PKD domain-containing protein [Bacteroidales bacterium]